MIVTGFMGSPRKGGNTAFLLKSFLEEVRNRGHETHQIHVPDLTVHPCTGCALCERKGYCHFDDDMQTIVFPLMRMSDVVILASPIYFYNVPAEMKAMIDRSQTLWSRKYKLRLKDPGQSSRKGFLLSVGATKGKDLFDSIHLTMKYFYLGIGADYTGGLTYSRIEDIGDMKRHPTVMDDIKASVDNLLSSLEQRSPSVWFVCKDNTLSSQMAQTFAQNMAGDRMDIRASGLSPGQALHPELTGAMEQVGLDGAYRRPVHLDSLLETGKPDHVVFIGSGDDTLVHVPGAKTHTWILPESPESSPEALARVRHWIEEKTKGLINELSGASV